MDCLHGHATQAAASVASADPSLEDAGRRVDTCAICLEDITDRAVAVPCNHMGFDFICLSSWVQEHATCPLCKTNLSAIEYEWASPDDYQIYRVPQPVKESQKTSQTPSRSYARPQWQRSLQRRRKYPRLAPSRPVDQETALRRRTQVYRDLTFSCHVGANRVSQFQEFTPQTFSHSKELQLKARKFLRRELEVFDFLGPPIQADTAPTQHRRYATSSEFVLEYIVSILKTVDVKDHTGRAQNMLSEFLGTERARLFLHEMSAWLRSPYSELDAWDRHVQYPASAPTESPTRGARSTCG